MEKREQLAGQYIEHRHTRTRKLVLEKPRFGNLGCEQISITVLL